MARFKKTEWMDGVNQKLLVRKLYEFHREFRIDEWQIEDIDHFLSVHNYLYPNEKAQNHHFRTIQSILERVCV